MLKKLIHPLAYAAKELFTFDSIKPVIATSTLEDGKTHYLKLGLTTIIDEDELTSQVIVGGRSDHAAEAFNHFTNPEPMSPDSDQSNKSPDLTVVNTEPEPQAAAS